MSKSGWIVGGGLLAFIMILGLTAGSETEETEDTVATVTTVTTVSTVSTEIPSCDVLERMYKHATDEARAHADIAADAAMNAEDVSGFKVFGGTPADNAKSAVYTAETAVEVAKAASDAANAAQAAATTAQGYANAAAEGAKAAQAAADVAAGYLVTLNQYCQ